MLSNGRIGMSNPLVKSIVTFHMDDGCGPQKPSTPRPHPTAAETVPLPSPRRSHSLSAATMAPPSLTAGCPNTRPATVSTADGTRSCPWRKFPGGSSTGLSGRAAIERSGSSPAVPRPPPAAAQLPRITLASRREGESPSWQRLSPVNWSLPSCLRIETTRAGVSTSRTSAPHYLLPPARAQDNGKLVVVLDLDETLVYSRVGQIMERPGLKELLLSLKDRCEVVVWTAGTRDYALDVIHCIDPLGVVQHCIYRHSLWWDGHQGCVKNLCKLGRPLNRTILIDNTPDVFRDTPAHSICVPDYVGFSTLSSVTDRTLFELAAMFDEVLRQSPKPSAADVLRHPHLKKRYISCGNGQVLQLNVWVSP